LVGVIFMIFSLVFIGVGSYQAHMQAWKLATYRPVSATIQSSAIRTKIGNKGGATYSPDISFTFVIDGQPQFSKTALMIDESSSHSWAEEIVGRFPPHAVVTAYHSPTERNRAFLVHEPTFLPYVFILFPILHFSVGLVVLMFGLGMGKTPQGKSSMLMFIALAIDLIGIPTFSHFAIIGGHWSIGPLVAISIYGGIALTITVVSIFYLVQMKKASVIKIMSDDDNPYRLKS